MLTYTILGLLATGYLLYDVSQDESAYKDIPGLGDPGFTAFCLLMGTLLAPITVFLAGWAILEYIIDWFKK